MKERLGEEKEEGSGGSDSEEPGSERGWWREEHGREERKDEQDGEVGWENCGLEGAELFKKCSVSVGPTEK